jgi:hypothetical protein
MDTCPYYHEYGTKPDAIPCCKHKHSPVRCFEDEPPARAKVLKCGGRLSRCEIPPYQQLDVS